MSITLAVASALLVSAIAVAEHWRVGAWEISSALFFGVPVAACVLAVFSFLHIRRELARGSGLAREATIGLAMVMVVAIGSMVFLRDRYHGDYSALRGRIAPDGSPVASVSWRDEGGRYVETINGRFQVELTQSQYREIRRKHQAPFLAGFIAFATIPVSMALVALVLARRRKPGAA